MNRLILSFVAVFMLLFISSSVSAQDNADTLSPAVIAETKASFLNYLSAMDKIMHAPHYYDQTPAGVQNSFIIMCAIAKELLQNVSNFKNPAEVLNTAFAFAYCHNVIPALNSGRTQNETDAFNAMLPTLEKLNCVGNTIRFNQTHTSAIGSPK
ncbi:MAG: hypothetical protein HQM09_06105 [Candidatus Riflebacteria bacterium]|nr:hypothetical protein [Candidatus Riflebacteria bacterium]